MKRGSDGWNAVLGLLGSPPIKLSPRGIALLPLDGYLGVMSGRRSTMAGTVKDSIGLPFTIFRARDAVDYDEAGCMEPQPVSEEQQAWSARMVEAGLLEGTTVKLLFSRPGLSLSYVWFKSGFPLPRHSHDADCAYFIIAGSLRIGIEELGPGDGFFVGANVPYTYSPGKNGVEVLEIRTANHFDIKLLAGKGQTYWEKALASLLTARNDWPGQRPPSGLSIGQEGST